MNHILVSYLRNLCLTQGHKDNNVSATMLGILYIILPNVITVTTLLGVDSIIIAQVREFTEIKWLAKIIQVEYNWNLDVILLQSLCSYIRT